MNENDSVILQFNKVVDKLFKHQQLNNKKAGEAQLQSEEFLTNYVPSHSDKFNSCNVSMQHLVNFIVNFFIKMSSTNQCRKFFFFIFTLSPGQRQVERGFSINKEIVIGNLHSNSLSAQRLVYEYLKASKKNMHDIEIRKKMLTSCKIAHSRYLIALEDAKRQS